MVHNHRSSFMKPLLIDGDIIMYQASYANERETDINAVLNYINELLYEIMINNQSGDYIAFLTGMNNFRYQLAEKNDYKATRKKEKPKWFFHVKEMLINDFGFVLTNGIEADDALTILSKKYPNSVTCTTDKDLLQYPGNFYNIRKKITFSITEEQANLNFWTQMLVGDNSDNIKCIRGIGPVGAGKMLSGKSFTEMCNTVLHTYMKVYGEYDGIKYFHQSYRLLRLLREHNEFVEPPMCHIDYLKPIQPYVRTT